MISSKIIVRKDKKNSRNEAPLFLRITSDRKTKFISLGIRVDLEYWNEESMQVERGHKNMARINNYLIGKLAETQSKSLELYEKERGVTSNTVKQSMLGKTGVDFLMYFDEHNKKLKIRDKVNSHRRANTVYNKIKAYQADKPLYFEDITVKWLKDYEMHLIKNENSINTVYTEMKVVRKLINEAINDDVITLSKSPFGKYKLKWENVEKNYLTEGELLALEDLSLTENSCMDAHRDIYIFACYTGGLRISDIFQLRWRDFDGEKVTIKTQKTNSVVAIKLPTKALEIIKKYKAPSINLNSYIFPILTKYGAFESETQKLKAISSANAYVNKDLKKLAKLASIDKHIHFHTSRHTWATRALRKGLRIEYVSKLMGHANIKTTQVYAKIVNEELDKAMDVFNEPVIPYGLKLA